jgi:hypothetical protein
VTIAPIPTKRWGDPTFKASAKASDGQPVKYAASGGCTINATSGQVTIKSVGTCKITAVAATGSPQASASVTFSIDQAQPVIKFGKRETRFKRSLNYALKATTTPSIPLAYKVIHGAAGTANDAFCTVKNGALVWTKVPTNEDHPSMDAFCMVRVSAATTSQNYVTPKAVQALVHIGYPAWVVKAGNQSISWAADTQVDANGRYAILSVSEDSGDALGMEINGNCGHGSTEGTNVPLRTRTYRVKFYLDDPAAFTYPCDLTASALPQDYHQGDSGIEDANFTLTVNP